MLFKGLVTVLAVDGLFVALSIPLILRKVRRNAIYGFRTCATLRDDFVWYEANAYFGRGLVVSGVLSAVAIVLLYGMDGVSQDFFFAATIVTMVVPVLVATLLTLRFMRSLEREGSSGTPRASTPRQSDCALRMHPDVAPLRFGPLPLPPLALGILGRLPY